MKYACLFTFTVMYSCGKYYGIFNLGVYNLFIKWNKSHKIFALYFSKLHGQFKDIPYWITIQCK